MTGRAFESGRGDPTANVAVVYLRPLRVGANNYIRSHNASHACAFTEWNSRVNAELLQLAIA